MSMYSSQLPAKAPGPHRPVAAPAREDPRGRRQEARRSRLRGPSSTSWLQLRNTFPAPALTAPAAPALRYTRPINRVQQPLASLVYLPLDRVRPALGQPPRDRVLRKHAAADGGFAAARRVGLAARAKPIWRRGVDGGGVCEMDFKSGKSRLFGLGRGPAGTTSPRRWNAMGKRLRAGHSDVYSAPAGKSKIEIPVDPLIHGNPPRTGQFPPTKADGRQRGHT